MGKVTCSEHRRTRVSLTDWSRRRPQFPVLRIRDLPTLDMRIMGNETKPIVIALPSYGFDPSEAAVSWSLLHAASPPIVFATPDGRPGRADEIMVSGAGLDWWSRIPALRRLKLMGLLVRANSDAREAYARMVKDPAYLSPLSYGQINPAEIDGLVLPGGHHKAMRAFLEDTVLQEKVRACFDQPDPRDQIPVAAICHGVLVLIRTRTAAGTSVVSSRRLTALPWELERKAWVLGRIFRFWDPHYYRTYLEGPEEPPGYWSVESEIKRSLDNPDQFSLPDRASPDFRLKTSGRHRDSETDARPAWVVRDGNLVTARWPGDVHGFAREFLKVVDEYRSRRSQPSQRGAAQRG